MNARHRLFCVILSLFVSLAAEAAFVSREELAQAREWTAARFEAKSRAQSAEPGLFVLANHDGVEKNGRGGKPMNIAGTKYRRGLYCHAFSKIQVRLPAPGAVFSAIIGVDSNEQTSGGRGSVDFSLSLAGAEKFRSGVIREGMGGKPVTVNLGGATEFVLQIDETADGISCDQSDWAEAKVTLQDGRELWLADLPLREATERRLFSTEPPFSFTYGLSAWLPFHGTGTVFARNASYYGSGKSPVEPYAFWSNASQLSLGLGIDMRVKDLDYPAIRQLLEQWRAVSANFYGDFYPLTPWTRDDRTWMAWQFDRPETGEGVVQVFRRQESFFESARLKLRGLDPHARYSITTLSSAGGTEGSGREWIENGLLVELAEKPSVAVVTYKRVR